MQPGGIDLLLQALDVSLERRKLVLAVLGLAAAGIIGGIFFVSAASVGNGSAAMVAALLGIVVIWVISALFTGAISKMSYEDLAGRPPPGMGEALRYAANHLAGLLFAPLLLWIAVLAAIIAEAVILLLGRIPAVGSILSALLFLPLVLINVFLLVFVLLGGWLVPAIIAGEGTGVVETLSRLRTIVRQAPGRITTYLAMTVFSHGRPGSYSALTDVLRDRANPGPFRRHGIWQFCLCPKGSFWLRPHGLADGTLASILWPLGRVWWIRARCRHRRPALHVGMAAAQCHRGGYPLFHLPPGLRLRNAH